MKILLDPIKRVDGVVHISGSKNATLPLMVCSMLTDETITLYNVPCISDVLVMKQLLEDIGIKIDYDIENKRMILKKGLLKQFSNLENIKKIRASIYVIGGLIANKINFKSYYPGGCAFSKRPIDYHLEAFKAVGYKITDKNNLLKVRKHRNIKQDLTFKIYKQSVGTTINLLIINVLRKYKTIIHNASVEPEVLEVINVLNKMNANIRVDNTTITIDGVKQLQGVSHHIMSDRIEAGSYMLLACASSKANLLIKDIDSSYLTEVINTIKELGVYVEINKNNIHIKKDYPLVGINKVASYYPMFPTDLQQILCVTCCKAITPSIIKDEIYPNRLSHVKELQKAKAKIYIKDFIIYIYPSILDINKVYAHDLRCGFACIVMGCLIKNQLIIENADIILRGYENVISKLKHIGVSINVE